MNDFLASLCALFIRIVCLSLRMEVIDHAGVIDIRDREPLVMAFWHNRIFLMTYLYEKHCPGHQVMTLISRSRDGQFITSVASRFGIQAARGSSSRNGTAAAIKAIHALKQEKMDICVTPDGPRGPRSVVQPGIFHLAQATGKPIVAMTTHVDWKIELKSWDKFQIPLPFSRCRLVLQPPIHVTSVDEESLFKLSALLAEALEKRD